MASKLGKFLAFVAVVGAACAGVYYFLNKDNECCSCDCDDCTDDLGEAFTKKASLKREYVSLSKDNIKSAAESIKVKLDEAAEELKEKAQNIAEGVGLVKDDSTETADFEFEDFTTEEDEAKEAVADEADNNTNES